MPRIDAFFRDAQGLSFAGSRRSSRSKVALGIAVVGFVLWWWWPGIASPGQESITVVGTGQVDSARQEVSRRLREEGFSLFWVDSIKTWCDLAELVPVGSTRLIVFTPNDLDQCQKPATQIIEDLNSAGYTNKLVVVDFDFMVDADPLTQKLIDYGVRRVASERLIGAIDEPLACQWWEDCNESGTTVTRTEQGLSSSGHDRLARLITAAVV